VRNKRKAIQEVESGLVKKKPEHVGEAKGPDNRSQHGKRETNTHPVSTGRKSRVRGPRRNLGGKEKKDETIVFV